MTDRSPEVEAPCPEAVRRSLRALAEGSTPVCDPKDGATGTNTQPASVVDDAEHAADCARKAASFLSAGRLPELGRAIATAARHGDDNVGARGRAARESLRRLDAVLAGEEETESTDCAGSSHPGGDCRPTSVDSGSNRGVGVDARPGADPQERDDHFHSGRGTVLGDTAQGSGR